MFGATRRQILRLTKVDFRWGSVPDSVGGAWNYKRTRGLTSKGRGGRKGERMEREEKGFAGLMTNSFLRACDGKIL